MNLNGPYWNGAGVSMKLNEVCAALEVFERHPTADIVELVANFEVLMEESSIRADMTAHEIILAQMEHLQQDIICVITYKTGRLIDNLYLISLHAYRLILFKFCILLNASFRGVCMSFYFRCLNFGEVDVWGI